MQTRPPSISQIVFLLPVHVGKRTKETFLFIDSKCIECLCITYFCVELCRKSVIYSTDFMFIDFCD